MVSFSRIRAAALLIAAAMPAGAQTAVVVRPSPLPNHKTVVTTTQELSIAATGVTASGPGKLVLDSKGALTFTRVNGSFDDQGQMEAQITLSHLEMRQAINGRPDSGRDTSAIVGRSLTAVFDRAGRLTDVKTPADVQQISTTVRQLLGTVYGLINGLPEAPMKVGDTVTSPGSIPLRLPGASDGSALQTRATVTLRRVAPGPAGRIAYLDQRIESAGPNERLAVSGKGTVEVNLDKGFIAATVMNWTVAGSISPGGGTGPGPPQSAQVEATFTISLSATEAP